MRAFPTSDARSRAALGCCAVVAVLLTVQLVALVVALTIAAPGPGDDGPSAFVAVLLVGALCTWHGIAAVAAWIAFGSAAGRSPYARQNVIIAMSVVAAGHALLMIAFVEDSAPAFTGVSGVVVGCAVGALACIAPRGRRRQRVR